VAELGMWGRSAGETGELHPNGQLGGWASGGVRLCLQTRTHVIRLRICAA